MEQSNLKGGMENHLEMEDFSLLQLITGEHMGFLS